MKQSLELGGLRGYTTSQVCSKARIMVAHVVGVKLSHGKSLIVAKRSALGARMSCVYTLREQIRHVDVLMIASYSCRAWEFDKVFVSARQYLAIVQSALL